MNLRDLPQRHKMSILAGVLLAMLLGALDATIVGPAMPTIVKELSGMAMLSWVFTIYSLTSTIAIPVVGKLSDLYGRKWFYAGGIVLFLLGSVLSGMAGEPWFNGLFATLTGSKNAMLQLIVFRGIQGLGGGTLMANAMAIIGDMFDYRERGRYQGMTGGVFGVASLLGPAVGGWLTDHASWRWIFFMNIPVGLLALAVLLSAMPRPERGQRHAIDWSGVAALVAGLVPLLLALSWGGSVHAWASPTILGLLATSAAAILVFGIVETRATEPIIDLALFRDRSFSASMVALFFSGVGMFGSIMFLPLYMQMVLGSTASDSGALLTPMMLGMIFGSITTGQLISRTGRYKMFGVVGLGLATVGMFLLSRLTPETSHAMVVFDMVLVGAGIGVTMPLFTIALQSQFPRRIGEVTAATQFFRTIGGTVGVALLGGVMNSAFARELTALVARDSSKFGAAAPMLSGLAENPAALLNAGAMQEIVAAVPPEARVLLARFFADVRIALASGIATTFLWAFGLISCAFIAMLLVREIPLSAKPHLGSPSEVGAEILAEEAVQPAEHEPVIVGEEAPAADL